MASPANASEEPLSLPVQLGGVVLALACVVAAIYAPGLFIQGFLDDFYYPLMNDGPVVRVNYGDFALPGILSVAVGLPVTGQVN